MMQCCHDGRQWNSGEPARSNKGLYRKLGNSSLSLSIFDDIYVIITNISFLYGVEEFFLLCITEKVW